MLAALLLVPALAGFAALLLRAKAARRLLLLVAAGLHAGLTGLCWITWPTPEWGGLLELDGLGLLFLALTSLLFAVTAIYTFSYLRHEEAGLRHDFLGGALFVNAPEARFIACLLFFLAAMSLVCVTQHLGLLWVGIEATTLVSAPLIYFHRHRRSLEAAWRYLVLCSVGIALALLGNILLTAAFGDNAGGSMRVSELVRTAASLNPEWFQAAFVFILVGYGTKMGLAPMHNWKPDAYSEAPSLVPALLSGALGNCAFLGILRVFALGAAAGQSQFAQELLVFFGLVSLAFAAVFIVGQGDFKRMLAYSSVEHMGLLALGVGLGGGAVFGAMFQAVNHSLTKAALFFLAGNILAVYHTKSSHDVQGVIRAIPATGILWVAGFLSIVGAPPFGTFLSELTIVTQAFRTGHFVVGGLTLGCLALIFIGMATAVLRMAQGPLPPALAVPAGPERLLSVLPSALLLALVLLLGLGMPQGVSRLLDAAAACLGPYGAF